VLAIIGGLRTLAMDVLNTHAHLLLAALTVRKWCHQALTRMAALPKEHPLYKCMNHQGIRKIKRHRGPIHHLLKWFKPDAKSLEKIPTMV